MKVLITGATGLVGRALAAELHRLGHRIVVLTRSKERFAERFATPCEAFVWTDYRQPPPLEAFSGVGAIVHLMGESLDRRRWSRSQKKVLHDSRIVSGVSLFEAAKRANIDLKVWVGASAIGIYGEGGDAHFTENSPPGRGFLAELCQQWEQTAEQAAAFLGCRFTVIRIGLVLGQGGLLEKLSPLFRRGFGGRLGNGHQWMSWIHVSDLVRLMIWMLEDPEVNGPVNGVSLNPVTNREFTQALADTMGVKVGPPAPKIALRIALGEIANTIVASQRVVPEKAVVGGFTYRYPTINQALASLVKN